MNQRKERSRGYQTRFFLIYYSLQSTLRENIKFLLTNGGTSVKIPLVRYERSEILDCSASKLFKSLEATLPFNMLSWRHNAQLMRLFLRCPYSTTAASSPPTTPSLLVKVRGDMKAAMKAKDTPRYVVNAAYLCYFQGVITHAQNETD